MKTQAALLCCLLLLPSQAISADRLEEAFRHPPDAARPQVYWMWMGCNVTATGITRDLEALKDAGFGGAVMVSLADVCTPWPQRIAKSPTPGVIAFSEPWWRLVRHAAREAHRLGLEFGFHNCAGYETSGGPWIPPELSMQEVVWSETRVSGPARFAGPLPRPSPDIHSQQPFPVYLGTSGKVGKPEVPARREYFRDIAVLAVPASGEVPREAVVDLSGRLAPDGGLAWDAPPGDWVIYRFGHTTTGAIIEPAQWDAIGLECDKMSREAVEFHLDHLVADIRAHAGDLVGRGLDFVWFDSYEAGTPTWTPRMREEFKSRRGYDLIPFLPVLAKRTIGSRSDTDRFAADFKRTTYDLYRDCYFAVIPRKLHAAGLRYRCEPYSGPWSIAEVAPFIDGLTAEFWVKKGAFDHSFVPQVVAAAREHGINRIDAEAFTAPPGDSQWSETPAGLKSIGDAAFCAGVNRFILHRFTHQPWGEGVRPGAAMGQWGTHFDRTQTWWEPAKAMVRYWQRCDALLQWGRIAPGDCSVASADPGLDVHAVHRSDGSAEAYFVANLARVRGTARCVFGSGGGQPELWDPDSGEIRDLPEFERGSRGTTIPLDLAPSQSFFIVFRGRAVAPRPGPGTRNFPEPADIGGIGGPWRVTFDPKWGGPAGPVEFASLEDWTARAEPGIRYYSGTAAYEAEFDLPERAGGRPPRILLDLGAVRDIASVSLNGRDLGVVWTAPWRRDITPAVRARGNRLVIRVTNCWANRQIGDEQEPPDCGYAPGDMGFGGPLREFPDWFLEGRLRPSQGRFTFSTWNYFTKDSPLLPSGLLGPVRLMAQQAAAGR